LQVEHPVTELITGLDLVHLQIRIAAGEKLPFIQNDVVLRGHAIECRIYAEDPENNFFPSPGRIAALSDPSGPGIRVDSGVYEGWNVPMEYDPLLAKLVAYGGTRSEAIGRLKQAFAEYVVGGVKTNLSLFPPILSDPDFLAGKTDTGYLSRLSPVADDSSQHEEEIAAIAAAIWETMHAANGNRRQSIQNPTFTWKRAARREAMR
jgi:acetyl-CoA carboxylase, biotin carboxylase subunit